MSSGCFLGREYNPCLQATVATKRRGSVEVLRPPGDLVPVAKADFAPCEYQGLQKSYKAKIMRVADTLPNCRTGGKMRKVSRQFGATL
ncbi:hypothetical protein J6590_029941 [Homalodisca vitripennis]|nr:hypothetical protein J6590_029941 [Homalodisca vitripennis]